jgi:hypothetical protein
MGELIDAMLNLSKISRQEMAVKEIDLSSLAESIIGKGATTLPDAGPGALSGPLL